MFTGIIQHVGEVRAVRSAGDGKRLTVDIGPLAEGLAVGDSVAVSGACLTACRIAHAEANFDVSAETLSRTTLGDASPGTRVNLERPLRLSDELGGHLVQGHIDGVGEVRRIDRRADEWAIELAAPKELTDEMVEKGSVAVAGVSLTLTHVADGAFGVALIPTTLEKTTFGEMNVGSKVNIETDVIGKYVRRYLRQASPASGPDGARQQAGLTLEMLREAGFA
ncbi:MAG: riboflavin synthase [Phycisphaerae bacterium]